MHEKREKGIEKLKPSLNFLPNLSKTILKRTTCFLINHVTKSGEIAGPKALESAVGCVIYIRRALRLRPLFVPKKRFKPAMLDPIVLTMDENALNESPHVSAQATIVTGYNGSFWGPPPLNKYINYK